MPSPVQESFGYDSPSVGRELSILRSDDALGALTSPQFLREWEELASLDPKCTWFQEPAFVLEWYQAYLSVCEPIVVLSRGTQNRLEGLMCLALMNPDGRICHAGDHQTEYHGWLARPESDTEFVIDAVNAVMSAFRPRSWRLRYLPPRASFDWIDRLHDWIGVSHEVVSVPIWDLTDTARLERKLKKGRVRNYINRYRRQGDLAYERLAQPTAIAAALDHLAAWCDLRQGAVNGVLPFRDDPHKLPFHEALASRVDRDRVLFSALKLDGRFLAIHMGGFDGDELFLGVQGHDPSESKLSPGTILLYELARDVQQRGGRLLDLTPGGDPWKERYATGHREIHSVELFGTKLLAERTSAVKTLSRLASSAARKAGLKPSRIRAAFHGILGSSDAPEERHLFAIDTGTLPTTARDAIDFTGGDSFLLSCSPTGALERKGFLSYALELLHRGWRAHATSDGSVVFLVKNEVVSEKEILMVSVVHEQRNGRVDTDSWMSSLVTAYGPQCESMHLSVSKAQSTTLKWASRVATPLHEEST